MKNIASLISVMLLLSSYTLPTSDAVVTINMARPGFQISEGLYGIFIEDINEASDGGLYAEMIKNRSFEDGILPLGYTAEGNVLVSPLTCNHVNGQMVQVKNRWDAQSVPGWTILPENTKYEVTDKSPAFPTAPHYLHISSQNVTHLVNKGFAGISINEGALYHLRVIARSPKVKTIKAQIISSANKVLASAKFPIKKTDKWIDQTVSLKASANAVDARLEITCEGTTDFDYISLTPDNTYRHRPNGMRRDVAEMIETLHPAFVRWPGGCVVEGMTLSTRFQWKQTLGDPASRPGMYNLWGYHSTCGVGWNEMLQFCEDLGAACIYVCNVGMTCQAQTSELLPISQVDSYLQDCLDAIEYAIGDAQTTLWGKRRADDGHPAPYPLRYIELGNENWGPAYDERFNLFYDAIKQRWPDLTIICNYGIDGTRGIRNTDMIDPHWFVAPDFFLNNNAMFDTIPRTTPKIYVGEYASNRSVGAGNLYGALGEAAFLMGIEHNGDLVRMASYAPLFESSWYRAWPTNMIWVSPTTVMGRSSYWVQRMMAENRPSFSLACSRRADMPEKTPYPSGQIGLGTWKSNVEFRNLSITLADGKVERPALASGTSYVGTWMVNDNGVLSQTDVLPRCKYMLPEVYEGTYTIEVEGRKTSGKDAFLIFFGMDANAKEGLVYSIGGKNNNKACVEGIHQGENTGEQGMLVDFHAEMDQWYRLRVEVSPDSSRLYVDGKYLLTHYHQHSVQHVYAAGYDKEKHELILKAVNVADTPYTVRYVLQNAETEGEGHAITLSSTSLTDENSFDTPDLIQPTESTFHVDEGVVDYTLAPHSLTILRIKARPALTATACGAIGDGKTLCTQAIQHGIDSLAAMGGGRLRLTSGTYLTGLIKMESNVELWLDKDATLLGSTDPRDYEKTLSTSKRGDEDVHLGLIVAEGARNISLRGQGTIDGQGLALALAIDSLHHIGERPDPYYNYRRMRPSSRPKLFFLNKSDGMLIEGLTLRNSAGWGLSIDRSKNIEISHVTVYNRAYWNNDGIDLNDCTNAEVHHCNIDAADDGICLKSDDHELRCEDIWIHDNRITSSASAVKMGTASYGGFRRVRIQNIFVYDTFRSAVALETVDGGLMEDIEVDGIEAVNTGNPIFVCLGGRHLRPMPDNTAAGHDKENVNRHSVARNITIRNVKAQVPFGRPDEEYDLRGPEVNYFHNPWPSSIAGLPGHDIENVTLENIDITYPGRATMAMAYVGLYRVKDVNEAVEEYPEFSMYGELPSWAFYVRHVNGITMKNINVRLADKDFRPAFVFDDVKQLKLHDINQPESQIFKIDVTD